MLHNNEIKNTPGLSKRAFWDIDVHALDFNRHAKFIIIRIFERGNQKDEQAILDYYGEHKIKHTLKGADSLMSIARERAKKLFHLSDNDFACCTSKQPARNLSGY